MGFELPESHLRAANKFAGTQVESNKRLQKLGRSSGQVVIGGDSCSKDREFESWHRILDGHFSHLFVVKLYCLFEKTTINEKEAGDGPFF